MRRGHLITLRMKPIEFLELMELVRDSIPVAHYAAKKARSQNIRNKAKRCLFLLRVKNVALKSYQHNTPVALTVNERRVLHSLISALNFENFQPVYLNKLADKLGMKKPNISRCFTNLVRKGLLIKGEKHQNYSTYKLVSKNLRSK